MKPSLVVAAFAVNLLAIPAAFALDQNLPAYQPVAGISGQLKSVGSDTLDHEMQLWAKGFQKVYPEVKIEIEGKGSATAPAALLEGVSQFGPMSRFMSAEEEGAFEKKFGYKVSAFSVAIDALAVYVNKDNPIQCLSMVEVDRIFSSTRKGSGGRSVNTWGDVGLTGEWASKPISIYGRNTIYGVAGDKSAIGYSGIGYKTDGVRAVPLSISTGYDCHGTSDEETRSGKYPIARYLYIYLNKKPNEALDPLRGEFIKFILSKDGQTLTEQGGYYPIANEMREAELKKLGLSAAAR